MENFIQKFHSGWAYVALTLLVIAVINALIGTINNKNFTEKDRKIGLFALIGTHIQLLVGLVLYFTSPIGLAVFGEMKEANLRLTSLEHPLIAIIAVAFITVGWSKHKKAVSNEAKFKSFAVFYTLGLIFILSRLPWNLWL